MIFSSPDFRFFKS